MSRIRINHRIRKEPVVWLTVALLGICFVPAVSLGAGPIFWDWPADRSFDEIRLDGAALDREGNLVAGLSGVTAGPVGPEVFWRIIPDGRGGYFTGTGHAGEIHHTTAKDKSRLVAQLGGTEVFSLLVRPDGELLAGCGPEGQLYAIDDKGQETLLGSVPGGYVWAMAAAPRGDTVWLAVGSPAAVFRFDPNSGSLTEAVSLPAQNALDLIFDEQGHLLVSTQGPGLIYRIDPDKPDQPRLVFETPQDEVRKLIAGPEGNLFALALNTEGGDMQGNGLQPGADAGSAPPALLSLMMEADGPQVSRAALYRLESDGLVTPWWTGEVDLMIAAWSPRSGWFGGGPMTDDTGLTKLYALTPPSGSHAVAGWSGGDILDILVTTKDGQDDSIIVCQAHPGSVTVLGDGADVPRFAVSPPLDGGLPVTWGRLNWTADGSGGKLKWSVRGGNRSEPDDSWSDWSSVWTDQDHALDIPVSRFLQWRVEFPTADPDKALRLTSVAVSAWQKNLPPMIASFTQEYLNLVHLGGMSNHQDNITQTFRSGLQAEFSRNSTVDRLAGPERSAVGRPVRVFSWEGADPNGDRLVYDLDYRLRGEEAWRQILEERSEPLGSWDTSEVPDGVYDLRLTVSDRPDNPGGTAAASSQGLGPIVVDNTEPVISGFKIELLTDGFQVKLTAKDAGSVLAGAQVRLPDGSVERLDPVDGICDSATEKFSATIKWPRTGRPAGQKPWRVRVDVRDLGGNAAMAEGDVR